MEGQDPARPRSSSDDLEVTIDLRGIGIDVFEAALQHGRGAPAGWLWLHRVLTAPLSAEASDHLFLLTTTGEAVGTWWQRLYEMAATLRGVETAVEDHTDLVALERRACNLLSVEIYLVSRLVWGKWPDWVRGWIEDSSGVHVEAPEGREAGSVGVGEKDLLRQVYEWLTWMLQENVEVPLLQAELEGEGVPPHVAFLRLGVVIDLVRARLIAAAEKGECPESVIDKVSREVDAVVRPEVFRISRPAPYVKAESKRSEFT